jgi:hypothetical protein
MTTTTPRPLRALYLTLALLFAAFAGSEIALASTSDDRGAFTACGTEEAPCMLEPVAVEAVPEDGHFAATSAARKTMRMRT